MSMSESIDMDAEEFPSDALLGACLATPDDPGVFPEKTAQELEVEERRRTSRFLRMMMMARKGRLSMSNDRQKGTAADDP